MDNVRQQRPKVLVVGHSAPPEAPEWQRARVEIYTDANIDFRWMHVPHLKTCNRADALIEQYAELVLPRDFLQMYIPSVCPFRRTIYKLTPQMIADMQWNRSIADGLRDMRIKQEKEVAFI